MNVAQRFQDLAHLSQTLRIVGNSTRFLHETTGQIATLLGAEFVGILQTWRTSLLQGCLYDDEFDLTTIELSADDPLRVPFWTSQPAVFQTPTANDRSVAMAGAVDVTTWAFVSLDLPDCVAGLLVGWRAGGELAQETLSTLDAIAEIVTSSWIANPHFSTLAKTPKSPKESDRRRLLEQNQNLSERNSNLTARTAELIQDKVQLEREVRKHRAASAYLQEASRHTDQFLATLAHELRAGLAPVLSLVEVLQIDESESRPVNGSAVEHDTARLAAHEQLRIVIRLVDDILDVSRLANGKVKIEQQPVPLTDAIRQAVRISQPLLSKREHEFVLCELGEPLTVMGDITRLVQVIANLLNNAAKYTHERGRVELRTERVDGFVELQVIDNGVGLGADSLANIFRPFSQIASSSSLSEGGMGLGLPLVQSLAEAHGGSIHVDSPGVGRGSTFTLRLPLIGTSGDSRPESVQGPGRLPDRQRILVVDDTPGLGLLTGRVLENLNQQVGVVESVDAALEKIAASVPDLILCDLHMPDKSGFDLARELRERMPGHSITLAAITGSSDEETVARCYDVGFHHHLTKPVNVGDLRALLLQAESVGDPTPCIE